MLTVATHPEHGEIKIDPKDRFNWSTAPAHEGWEHPATIVYRVSRIEGLDAAHHWRIPEDAPEPRPSMVEWVFVTTGDSWRYCSPERLISLQVADIAPIWPDDADPDDETREWWDDLCQDGLRCQEQDLVERWDRWCDPNTACPLDLNAPHCWFLADEDAADAAGVEHAENETEALNIAASLIHEGRF